jgi:Tol biopolymer transport system component
MQARSLPQDRRRRCRWLIVSTLMPLLVVAGWFWSPIAHGSERPIVFEMKRKGHMSIFRIDIAGSHLHRLTHGHKDLNPTWSSDGRHIAFVRRHSVTGWDVFVMRASGRNVVDTSNEAGGDSFPAWSPNGTQIAYTCQPGRRADICMMNADGSEQTDLTNYHSDHFYPAWSPAGHRIAFESNQGTRCPALLAGRFP